MNNVALFIRNTAKPGRRDDITRVWEKHVRDHVAASDAVLSYYYCNDDKDPDTVTVFLLVADKQRRLQDILQQPWYAEYKRQTAAMLAGPPEVRTATPEWVKDAAA